tara:strand:+ start:1536 stop:1721 length:186 start_codon:yes stop_codon:yes gene_type:complete
MKIKGLEDKIYRINPNSVNFSMAKLEKLKEGGVVDLSKDDAESLINKGMAVVVKSSKKGDK